MAFFDISLFEEMGDFLVANHKVLMEHSSNEVIHEMALWGPGIAIYSGTSICRFKLDHCVQKPMGIMFLSPVIQTQKINNRVLIMGVTHNQQRVS